MPRNNPDIKMNYYLNRIKENPNNLSFWYPKIKDCGFITPKTVIVPVPDDTIKAFFFEKPEDKDKVSAFVHDEIMPALKDINGLPFIKNGCFSNKFDFSTCCPADKEEDTLTKCISEIQYTASCFDMMGNSEIVLRERIPSPAGLPTIYNGLPLNCEARVFFNFDTKNILYTVNYWDKNYCSKKIHNYNSKDGETYDKRYPEIEELYKSFIYQLPNIKSNLMKTKGLYGVWSIDFLFEPNGKLWLIDMAMGSQSAYWDAFKGFISDNIDRIAKWLADGKKLNVHFPFEYGSYFRMFFHNDNGFLPEIKKLCLEKYRKDKNEPSLTLIDFVQNEADDYGKKALEVYKKLESKHPSDGRASYVQKEMDTYIDFCFANAINYYMP